MIDFKLLAEESFSTAVNKGWYRKDEQGEIIQRDADEVCALFHSEISEAVEELRQPNEASRKGIYFKNDLVFTDEPRFIPDNTETFPDGFFTTADGKAVMAKPEGVAVELADLLIRLGDSAEAWGVAYLVGNSSGTKDLLDFEAGRLKRSLSSPVGELTRVHRAVSLLWTRLETRMAASSSFDDVTVTGAIEAILLGVQALCTHYGWDLERAIKIKLVYNSTRPYRHGARQHRRHHGSRRP